MSGEFDITQLTNHFGDLSLAAAHLGTTVDELITRMKNIDIEGNPAANPVTAVAAPTAAPTPTSSTRKDAKKKDDDDTSSAAVAVSLVPAFLIQTDTPTPTRRSPRSKKGAAAPYQKKITRAMQMLARDRARKVEQEETERMLNVYRSMPTPPWADTPQPPSVEEDLIACLTGVRIARAITPEYLDGPENPWSTAASGGEDPFEVEFEAANIAAVATAPVIHIAPVITPVTTAVPVLASVVAGKLKKSSLKKKAVPNQNITFKVTAIKAAVKAQNLKMAASKRTRNAVSRRPLRVIPGRSSFVSMEVDSGYSSDGEEECL